MCELDVYDQIVSLGPLKQAATRRPLRAVRPDHLVAIRWLDRFGFMTTAQLHRAVAPGLSLRTTQTLLSELHRAGLVESRRTQLALDADRGRGGSTPRIWSLTTAGFRLGQKSPGFYRPMIPRSRSRRRSEIQTTTGLRHDLHVTGWWLAFNALVGGMVQFPDVFTPRYEEGQLRPPRLHQANGRGSRPIERRDITLGDELTFADVSDEPFTHTIQPDLTIHLHIQGFRIGRHEDFHADLLIEVDRTKRAAYNRAKLARYDAFLTAWALAHPRYEQSGARPVVIFTSPDPQAMLSLMKVADKIMNGRIGHTGDPYYQWHYPGRDHILFATEVEIHHGSLRAWRLPEQPRALREEMGDDGFRTTEVAILPRELASRSKE